MYRSQVAKQQWFLDVLKQEENGNKVGYDGMYWSPHASPEGGKDTIGYGHKILTDIVRVGGKEFNLKYDRLTESDTNKLLVQDIALAEKKASQQFTTLDPMKGTRWRDLPLTYKTILTEIVFNTKGGLIKNGKSAWPSLIKGMENQNHPTILKEIMRGFTNAKGVVKPLTKRVTALRKAYKKHLGVSESPTGGQIQRLQQSLPFFDTLGKQSQARLLAKMVAEDQRLERERSIKQVEYDVLMEEANERDRQVQEALEGEQRLEAEATLQQEVQSELSTREEQTFSQFDQRLQAVERVDETSKVITEQLADVQYFQREDGTVVKTDSSGNILN